MAGNAKAEVAWLGSDGAELSRFEGGTNGIRLAIDDSTIDSDPHGEIEEDTRLRSLDEIPDHINSAWWNKYGHNLTFRDGRLCLRARN